MWSEEFACTCICFCRQYVRRPCIVDLLWFLYSHTGRPRARLAQSKQLCLRYSQRHRTLLTIELSNSSKIITFSLCLPHHLQAVKSSTSSSWICNKIWPRNIQKVKINNYWMYMIMLHINKNANKAFNLLKMFVLTVQPNWH